MTDNSARIAGVSEQTDKLASELLGQAFDLLAAGEELPVLLAVEDEQGEVASYSFADDGLEACIEGAYAQLRSLVTSEGARGVAEAGVSEAHSSAVRYAIVYRGAVSLECVENYCDAVLLEFGERGYQAYSAYSLVDKIGCGEEFSWTDPAPAGEVEPLL